MLGRFIVEDRDENGLVLCVVTPIPAGLDALQAAGVVFVGADLAADGLGTLPTDASRRRVVECPACAFAIG